MVTKHMRDTLTPRRGISSRYTDSNSNCNITQTDPPVASVAQGRGVQAHSRAARGSKVVLDGQRGRYICKLDFALQLWCVSDIENAEGGVGGCRSWQAYLGVKPQEGAKRPVAKGVLDGDVVVAAISTRLLPPCGKELVPAT